MNLGARGLAGWRRSRKGWLGVGPAWGGVGEGSTPFPGESAGIWSTSVFCFNLAGSHLG